VNERMAGHHMMHLRVIASGRYAPTERAKFSEDIEKGRYIC
jgi:hypothetical protein